VITPQRGRRRVQGVSHFQGAGFRLWVEDGLRLRVFMFFVFELVRVVGVFRVFRVVGC
jgi:hypothetical protein